MSWETLSNHLHASSGCIPWPCFELLGEKDPEICQHYVQAPNDVKVEFVHEPNPKSDTIVVSWKPSFYGMCTWLYSKIHTSLLFFHAGVWMQFLWGHTAFFKSGGSHVAVWLVLNSQFWNSCFMSDMSYLPKSNLPEHCLICFSDIEWMIT